MRPMFGKNLISPMKNSLPGSSSPLKQKFDKQKDPENNSPAETKKDQDKAPFGALRQ